MARPRTPFPIIQQIQRLRARGRSIDQITDAVDKKASRNTVAKYVKEWSALPEEERNALEPVDWSRIEDFGLPPESLPHLLSIWIKCPYWRKNQPGPELPSGQEVRWWWRILQAAPGFSHEGMWGFVNDIVLRERWAFRQGKSAELDDVWAYLAWGGWKPESEDSRYKEAVAEGEVPPKKNVMDFVLRDRRS